MDGVSIDNYSGFRGMGPQLERIEKTHSHAPPLATRST